MVEISTSDHRYSADHVNIHLKHAICPWGHPNPPQLKMTKYLGNNRVPHP